MWFEEERISENQTASHKRKRDAQIENNPQLEKAMAMTSWKGLISLYCSLKPYRMDATVHICFAHCLSTLCSPTNNYKRIFIGIGEYWIFNLSKHVALSQAEIHFVARFCSLIYSFHPAVSFISCVAIIQMQFTFTNTTAERERERNRDHFYAQACKRNAKTSGEKRRKQQQTTLWLMRMCMNGGSETETKQN